MEAPRGAREPTGTNGPTPHQPPQPPTGGTTTPGQPPPARRPATGPPDQPGGRRNHYTNHDQPTPHPATRRARTPRHTTTAGQQKGGRTTQSCGGHSTGETPSNIPNLEAKPGRANGTAPQGVRESRKPPQHTTRGGRAHKRGPPTHAHTRAHATTQQRGHTHATTRTRASYCARPPSGLRLFMFQQSSGR